MSMRPYQVMFGGRLPFMTEENWLTVAERKEAKIPNEDGSLDDEDSINFQARIERSDTGTPFRSSQLPGDLIRQGNLIRNFVPGSQQLVDFEYVDHFLSPSRDMGPLPQPQRQRAPTPTTSSSLLRLAQQAPMSEAADFQLALRLQ